MKKSIVCLVLTLVLTAGLLLSVCAANTPDLSFRSSDPKGGNTVVSMSLTNIPSSNPVLYAQIELTCVSNDHNIVKKNSAMVFWGNTTNMQVTTQFGSTADSLLLLIEPQTTSFAGRGTGQLLTFEVSNGYGDLAAPAFDLKAVLILKDGTEYEVSRKVTAYMDDACMDSHNYVSGVCVKCGYTQPTTGKPTTVKPTTVKPTTAKPTTAKPTTVAPTTKAPTIVPTTKAPTVVPSTVAPTVRPTVAPTTAPDVIPTFTFPTQSTAVPSAEATQTPTEAPTTAAPTVVPTATPQTQPTAPTDDASAGASGWVLTVILLVAAAVMAGVCVFLLIKSRKDTK